LSETCLKPYFSDARDLALSDAIRKVIALVAKRQVPADAVSYNRACFPSLIIIRLVARATSPC
jgi:hypothetical protein